MKPENGWFLALTVALLLVLWCATGNAQDDYWTKAADPVTVREVIEVEWPCGRDLYGCAERSTGLIFVKRGLRPALRECVLNHEKRHMAGYVHPQPRGIEFSTDCGDGTLVPS